MNIVKASVNYLSKKFHDILTRLQEYPLFAFIFRVIKETGEDNAGDMAAGIAYYAILSIFPLLLGIIAVLGLFLPSETVQTQIFDFAGKYLPGSVDIIQQNVERVIKLRGALGVISVLGLFWTGSAIFEAIGRVINKAWDISVKRPFIIRKLRILLMSFGTGILFLLSMAASSLSSIVRESGTAGLRNIPGFYSWLAGFILLFFMFLLLFKYLPNTKTYWRYIWPGALFTAILFEIVRFVFTYYLSRFANYDMIYGSLAAVVILLVWVYFSAFILIIGSEFNSEYSRLHTSTAR